VERTIVSRQCQGQWWSNIRGKQIMARAEFYTRRWTSLSTAMYANVRCHLPPTSADCPRTSVLVTDNHRRLPEFAGFWSQRACQPTPMPTGCHVSEISYEYYCLGALFSLFTLCSPPQFPLNFLALSQREVGNLGFNNLLITCLCLLKARMRTWLAESTTT
jgi:hypothetical protein